MPPTITQALYADHVAVRRDLARALSNPNLIPALYPGIQSALRRHDKAEAATLYRALGEFLPEQAQIEVSLAEHAELGAQLDLLDTLSYADPMFLVNLRRAQAMLEAHLEVEETQVFAAARSLLPLARQIQLAQRYEVKMGRGRIGHVSLVRPGLRRPRRNPAPVLMVIAEREPARPWWHHFVGGVPVFIRGSNSRG